MFGLFVPLSRIIYIYIIGILFSKPVQPKTVLFKMHHQEKGTEFCFNLFDPSKSAFEEVSRGKC